MSWSVTEAAIELAAARLSDQLHRFDGPVTLAIPGGSTPGPVLERLPLDDLQLTATLVDERHLPLGQNLPSESNTRLLRRFFPGRSVEWARTGNLDEVAAQLERDVPDPDVVLLGMGPDGHIASLFPGRPHDGARILAVRDSPKPPPERLTMSLSLLNRARYVLVVVRGEAKAQAVHRAWRRDPALPTTHLKNPTVEWICDPAAAHLLPEIP